MSTLDHLVVGKEAIIEEIFCTGSMRRRLLDIGLTPGSKINCVGISPCGDPKAFLIRGAVIALRNEDSSQIRIG